MKRDVWENVGARSEHAAPRSHSLILRGGCHFDRVGELIKAPPFSNPRPFAAFRQARILYSPWHEHCVTADRRRRHGIIPGAGKRRQSLRCRRGVVKSTTRDAGRRGWGTSNQRTARLDRSAANDVSVSDSLASTSTAILSEAERAYAERIARELPAVIEIDDLPRWIGMSRASIYRLRQRNRFPIRPLSPTTRRVQFAGVDVLRYLLRSRG